MKMDKAPPPTYYDQPAVKPPPYDWRISGYIFLAGLAGAGQIISTLADRGGPEQKPLVRNGRILGLVGTILGTPMLIADLKTPKRFYNMLRIFRPTSAMSIGSYILTDFGFFSGVTALGQGLAARLPWIGKLVGLSQGPAAVYGAGMSVYTASLLSATSNPLWSAAPRALGAQFGAASMATAAAALSLAEAASGRRRTSATLDALVMISAISEGVAGMLAKHQRQAQGVDAPLSHGTWAWSYRAALVLGIGVPLACHGLNLMRPASRRSERLSIAGSLATLAGGALLRHTLLRAGMDSAKDPALYLHQTQPGRR